MQLLNRVLATLALACLFASLVPLHAAQEQRVARGRLLRLDVQARKIVIRTDIGSQMQFEYTGDTVVSGAEASVAGLRTEAGREITVTYEKQETRMLAVHVGVDCRQ